MDPEIGVNLEAFFVLEFSAPVFRLYIQPVSMLGLSLTAVRFFPPPCFSFFLDNDFFFCFFIYPIAANVCGVKKEVLA